jgi:hypothetical protein
VKAIYCSKFCSKSENGRIGYLKLPSESYSDMEEANGMPQHQNVICWLEK